MSTPWLPSTISRSPVFTSRLTRLRPTTAGMALAWAMMAVWLVGPPMSVTNPMTLFRSILVVSAGERSWAHHDHLAPYLVQGVVGLAHQVPEQLVGDVLHVREAGADVGVLDAREEGLGLGHRLTERPFRVDRLLVDDLHGALGDHLVRQDHQVGFDDIAGVGPGRGQLVCAPRSARCGWPPGRRRSAPSPPGPFRGFPNGGR